jgi:hypothetical protein
MGEGENMRLKMKGLVLAISVSMFFSGCHKEPEQTSIVDRVTGSFTKELEETEGFYLSAAGGRLYPLVKVIDLSYITQRKVDLPEARRLLIQTITKLLKVINESDELKQKLTHHPYTPNGIRFGIFFRDEKMKQFTDDSIASVYLFGLDDPARTVVLYKKFDPEKGKWITIHEETYEEAERIVLRQRDGGDTRQLLQ